MAVQGPEKVLELPGGKQWLKVINRAPERERHLSIHQGHFLEMNEADAAAADAAAWDAGRYVSLPQLT